MTKPERWYESLSRPSQLILLTYLALCLVFGLRIIGRVRDHGQMQAAFNKAKTELAEAQETERGLIGEEQNEEIELERAVREEVLGALSDETIIAPQSAPEAPFPDGAYQLQPQAVRTPWQQWWNLFFSPTAEKDMPATP
ncbi:MAG: hypothetical protein H8D78_14050 [Chloroflexi bacterium]|nr:hypothetical protein [Chloroflexota bacterium]